MRIYLQLCSNGMQQPAEGQTKPASALGSCQDSDLQQYELRKPEHQLFLLAQWLGHQPLTQKILLVLPCLRVLGLL